MQSVTTELSVAELFAVLLALVSLARSVGGHTLQLGVDSQTTLSILRKRRVHATAKGPQRETLWLIFDKIACIMALSQISLDPFKLSSADNDIADAASRLDFPRAEALKAQWLQRNNPEALVAGPPPRVRAFPDLDLSVTMVSVCEVSIGALSASFLVRLREALTRRGWAQPPFSWSPPPLLLPSSCPTLPAALMSARLTLDFTGDLI
jgi:hypothetical protein